jgi:WD40 repeat protein
MDTRFGVAGLLVVALMTRAVAAEVPVLKGPWLPLEQPDVGKGGYSLWSGSFVFLGDGRLLVGGGSLVGGFVWETRTGKVKVHLPGELACVLAVPPDGKILASGSKDGLIQLWETSGWKRLVTLEGHARDLDSLRFTPDGKYLVSVGRDGIVLIWDVKQRKILHRLVASTQPNHQIMSALSKDGSVLAAEDGECGVTLWEVSSGKRLRRFTVGDTCAVNLTFSPDGRRLACQDNSTQVTVWCTLTGRKLGTAPCEEQNSLLGVFLPDSERLIIRGWGQVRVWNIRKNRVEQVLRGHSGKVNFACLSEDGSRLVTGDDEAVALVWDVKTWRTVLRVEDLPFWMYGMLSPDGRQLVITGRPSLSVLGERTVLVNLPHAGTRDSAPAAIKAGKAP